MTYVNKVCFIYTTIPTRKDATFFAEKLIEKHLVACVNQLPKISSCYRWEGKITWSIEYPLLCKTTVHKEQDVYAYLKKRHPYDVPCIVTLSLERGETDFVKWIQQQVKEHDTDCT